MSRIWRFSRCIPACFIPFSLSPPWQRPFWNPPSHPLFRASECLGMPCAGFGTFGKKKMSQVHSGTICWPDQLSPVALRQDLCCGLHTLDFGTEDSAVHLHLFVFYFHWLRLQHHRSVSGRKDVGESAWILQKPLGSYNFKVNLWARGWAVSKRPPSATTLCQWSNYLASTMGLRCVLARLTHETVLVTHNIRNSTRLQS